MYNSLAHIYDRLMRDIDYGVIAANIESIFEEYGVKPELILELGCGTGNLLFAVESMGYDVIGIDNSSEMLTIATEKSKTSGSKALLIMQDIRSFELYGTVGAVLAGLDVINHVTEIRGLRSLLDRVRNYLEPGGLFIFDLNSPWKLSTMLPSQTFYQIDEEVTWIWNSSYNARKRICTLDLTFFISDGKGLYRREDEVIEERAWKADEIKRLLEENNLELLSIKEGYTQKEAGQQSERLLFVARRVL